MKTALLFIALLAALVVAGCGSSSSSSSSGTSTTTSGTSAKPDTTTGAKPESAPAPGSTAPEAPQAEKQASYLQGFQEVNDKFEGSPEIGDLNQALAAATGTSGAGGAAALAAAEPPLKAYLHRLDTYIAELRGLHFPACARHFQTEIVRFESEGRTAVAKILPLLGAGKVIRVSAYVKRAAPILAAKLGQVEVKQHALENGGNDGC